MARFLATVLLMLAICRVLSEAQDGTQPYRSLLGPMVTFDPAHQKPITYSDASVRVRLLAGKAGDSLTILTLGSQVEKRVALPDEIAQVENVRKVVGNKLVVHGMINGSGSEIVIIDLSSARQVDKFVCYGPSVSPDGRYIAFIKFYPAHFSDGTDDHYMLYDLSLTPAENRPSGVGQDNWLIAGRCVYPVGCGNRAGDNNGVPEESRHLSSSGLYWNSAKDDEFVFADRVGLSEAVTIVLAEVAADGRVSLRTVEQRTERLCPNALASNRPCSLLVRKLTFGSGAEPKVTATFEIVDSQRLETLEYRIAEFR